MVAVLQDFVKRFQLVCQDEKGKTAPEDKKRIEAVRAVINAIAEAPAQQPPTPLATQTFKEAPKTAFVKPTANQKDKPDEGEKE
jgi:hypothetical protein